MSTLPTRTIRTLKLGVRKGAEVRNLASALRSALPLPPFRGVGRCGGAEARTGAIFEVRKSGASR